MTNKNNKPGPGRISGGWIFVDSDGSTLSMDKTPRKVPIAMTGNGLEETRGYALNDIPGLAVTRTPRAFLICYSLTHMKSGLAVVSHLFDSQVANVVNAIRNVPIDWTLDKDAIEKKLVTKTLEKRLLKAIREGKQATSAPRRSTPRRKLGSHSNKSAMKSTSAPTNNDPLPFDLRELGERTS